MKQSLMGSMRGSRGVESRTQGFLVILVVRIFEKSQGDQAIIQCWAIFGTPAKGHLNAVSLVCRIWPAYIGGIWILPRLIN